MTPPRQRRWNLVAITAVVVAALMAISAISRIDRPQVSTGDRLYSNAAPGVLAREQPAEALFPIEIGVYATSTSELDLNVPSFNSSGYVWMRWSQAFQDYLEQNETTVQERMVVLNELISDTSPVLEPIGKPKQEADGRFYELFSFRGRYYINNASFRHFPFMTVSLPIAIEPDDIDGQLDYSRLRFIPDSKDSGMGLYASIIGWLNHGWSIAEYRHHYATNFGLADPSSNGQSDYSQLIFSMLFGTSAWASFWRLLLPLSVVMSMVLLVFKVRSDEQDARASIPVTVLLTLVFLQQSYRNHLPELPFLTFLDQVYVVAYGVTLAAFVLVLWIGRRYSAMEHMPEGPAKDSLLLKLERLDVIWPLVVVVFGATAIAICWLTIPS